MHASVDSTTQATSSAEGGVDRLVRSRFFPGTGDGRVFVEVGAAGPDYLSISAHYRSLGWRVVAVEPNPDFCRLHEAKGLEVLQYACGNRDADGVEFLVVDSQQADYENGKVTYESFSSLGIKDEYARLGPSTATRKILVRLRRLDTLLREHAPDVARIDILSIDVEGWELEVLEGLDLARYRPGVIVIENLFNSSAYRSYLVQRGYLLWRRIYPNDVFVHRDLMPGLPDRIAAWCYHLTLPLRR